jgi:carbon monoxide dehydrogenase subunit G
MIKVKNITQINAPVEKVFAYVNDPENSTKWQSGVDSVEYEGEQTVGGQYTEVRKFMGREMRTTLEITGLETNQRYAAKTLSGPVPYQVEVLFEEVDGGTKMTTLIEAEPGGFFKLAEGAVRKQLESGIKEDNETLKKLLETA